MTSLFLSLPCHPSLRSRLEHSAFDGFEIEDATREFTTEEIEFALYGPNAKSRVAACAHG
ncbi:hypothetical protein PVT71_00220 [Salipiger sp. H15]|uniref:Uncharacterized protein n=1 Tax=Alloyangia sp. H15 TaxID=3029062 RepID=A0AAU8AGX0_9RHOB